MPFPRWSCARVSVWRPSREQSDQRHKHDCWNEILVPYVSTCLCLVCWPTKLYVISSLCRCNAHVMHIRIIRAQFRKIKAQTCQAHLRPWFPHVALGRCGHQGLAASQVPDFIAAKEVCKERATGGFHLQVVLFCPMLSYDVLCLVRLVLWLWRWKLLLAGVLNDTEVKTRSILVW